MSNPVTYESNNGVAVITINRPERMNAIGPEVEAGLREAWKKLRDSPDDRVGILTGAGSKAFSAGKDMKSSAPPDYRSFTPGVGVLIEKPLIAAISGWCIGGAVVIAQFCDLCIATEDSRFMYPEAAMGFAGGMIASLATRIPLKVAMELMLMGEVIDAQRAYDIGMINKIVPVGQHMDAAFRVAERLARNAPLVLQMLKRLVEATIPRSPVEIAGHAWRENSRVFESLDYQEGIKAFQEKREPSFHSK